MIGNRKLHAAEMTGSSGTQPNLDLVLSFLLVVREGGYAPAGRLLGITGTSTRERVEKLEEQLGGVKLIEGSKPLKLTKVGTTLATRAGPAADALQTQWLFGLTNLRNASLRIAATGVAVQYELPPVLSAWCKEHPTIPFQVIRSDSEGVLSLLQDGRVDFAIGRIPKRDVPGVEVVQFEGQDIVIAFPDDGRAGASPDVHTIDAAFPWIMPTTHRDGLDLLTRAIGSTPRMLVEVPTYEDTILYVQSGVGATLCSRSLIDGRDDGIATLPAIRLTSEERRFRGALMWVGGPLSLHPRWLEDFKGEYLRSVRADVHGK